MNGPLGARQIELRGISKRFGAVIANDNVDLTLRPREVHALLGENGAGKTTLMNILAGVYQPNSGRIYISGEEVRFRSPRDAIQHAVGMVHQEFELIDTFTTIENVVLGRWTGRIGRAQLAAELETLSDRLGLHVEPHALIWQLSVGERQRVEVLRLLHRGARILILDEPTAILTPQEAEALFKTLRRLAAEDHTVVIITHKLNEVMRVADRVTVLRGGRVVAERLKDQTDPEELAYLMVGRYVGSTRRQGKHDPGEPILRVTGVGARGDRGHQALQDVSFEVGSGEILGVAGVAGNGQSELAEVVAGLRPLTGGHIELNGRDVTHQAVDARFRDGLAYVPEERLGRGLIGSLGLVHNLSLRNYRSPPIGGKWLFNVREARGWTERLVAEAQIKSATFESPVRLLSGGNQQRALMARELANDPVILVAAQPTRGLDVSAAEQVQNMLLELRQRGSAILLISEDLDELFALSDRMIVLFGGRIAGAGPTDKLDKESLGLLMTGSDRAARG